MLNRHDFGYPAGHVDGRRVLDTDHPDLVAVGRWGVELLDDGHHAFDVFRLVRDDERRSVGDDVSRFALQAVEHGVGQIIGVQVRHAHQLGHVSLVVGHAFAGTYKGQGGEARARCFDDAQEFSRRLNRQAHRFQRGEEEPIGLLGRDQLGRDDGDLLALQRDGNQELRTGDA